MTQAANPRYESIQRRDLEAVVGGADVFSNAGQTTADATFGLGIDWARKNITLGLGGKFSRSDYDICVNKKENGYKMALAAGLKVPFSEYQSAIDSCKSVQK